MNQNKTQSKLAALEKLVSASHQLKDVELSELRAWEQKHLGRGLKTSDWPGWDAVLTRTSH